MSIRRIALTSAAVTLAFTTFVQARPDTRAMTCQQTQASIQSHGSAVLTTGPNTYAPMPSTSASTAMRATGRKSQR